MMKLGTVVKIVGGIAAISVTAIGAIMLIGKKVLNKHDKEAAILESPTGKTTEEAAVVTADIEENTSELFDGAHEEEPKTPDSENS